MIHVASPSCRWSSIAGEAAKRSVKRISDTYALEVSCFRFSLHGFSVVVCDFFRHFDFRVAFAAIRIVHA